MEKGRFLRRSMGAVLIFGLVASADTGVEGRAPGQDGPAVPPVSASLARPDPPGIPPAL